MAELWERDNILPTEEVPHGDDQSPSPVWNATLAGHVQPTPASGPRVLRPSVSTTWSTRTGTLGTLDENRKAAWCYVALAMDKMINRNSLLITRWDSGTRT